MDEVTSVPATTQTLIAEFGDILPPTFIASTVQAAASAQRVDAPPAADIARADVRAAAEAAVRGRAAANAIRASSDL
jgi:hypothetical protein